MSANDSKVYYWLKLSKNFFDNHKIRVIEGLPNGKDYILFYLKLMCESTSHEGTLRFSDDIPYDLSVSAFAGQLRPHGENVGSLAGSDQSLHVVPVGC